MYVKLMYYFQIMIMGASTIFGVIDLIDGNRPEGLAWLGSR